MQTDVTLNKLSADSSNQLGLKRKVIHAYFKKNGIKSISCFHFKDTTYIYSGKNTLYAYLHNTFTFNLVCVKTSIYGNTWDPSIMYVPCMKTLCGSPPQSGERVLWPSVSGQFTPWQGVIRAIGPGKCSRLRMIQHKILEQVNLPRTGP